VSSTLSDEDRAAAKAIAAAMPLPTPEQRDRLALLLRPAKDITRRAA
jgi:hypothetical protein